MKGHAFVENLETPCIFHTCRTVNTTYRSEGFDVEHARSIRHRAKHVRETDRIGKKYRYFWTSPVQFESKKSYSLFEPYINGSVGATWVFAYFLNNRLTEILAKHVLLRADAYFSRYIRVYRRIMSIGIQRLIIRFNNIARADTLVR